MKKGINLQAKLHVGGDPAAASTVKQALPSLFARTNPGLQLSVAHVTAVDSSGNAVLRVYIEGDQDPAADFAALTRGALNKTIAILNAGASTPSDIHDTSPTSGSSDAGVQKSAVHITDIREMEGDEEDTGVTLAPKLQAQAQAKAQTDATSPVPTGSHTPPSPTQPVAPQAQPPAPVATTSTRPSPWWAFWRRNNNS